VWGSGVRIPSAPQVLNFQKSASDLGKQVRRLILFLGPKWMVGDRSGADLEHDDQHRKTGSTVCSRMSTSLAWISASAAADVVVQIWEPGSGTAAVLVVSATLGRSQVADMMIRGPAVTGGMPPSMVHVGCAV
jgi:hypothetical protein